jgi:hypothetical protein
MPRGLLSGPTTRLKQSLLQNVLARRRIHSLDILFRLYEQLINCRLIKELGADLVLPQELKETLFRLLPMIVYFLLVVAFDLMGERYFVYL